MSEESASIGSARDRAVRVLTACYDGYTFGQDLLAEMQAAQPLASVDAALASELVIGVSRHRLTAEHLASRFYRGRWGGVQPSVRVILATAVYQLCWLDRVPDYAAVDQAVRQAKRHGRGASSIVNAVLRRVTQCRGDVIDRPSAPDPRRYLPIDANRGRVFSENVLPDPARRPLDYLVVVTSHPPWLVERWHRRFKPALCRQVCEAGQRRPALVLRPNVMRIAPEDLCRQLVEQGGRARLLSLSGAAVAIGGPAAVLVEDGPAADSLEAVTAGFCQPQDSTSQLALRLAPPQPGEFVLDLCAGVGTKATQAAELMRDSGIVVASDTDESKLARIPASAERLGLHVIKPVPADCLDGALAEIGRRPDVILVDAPCTNTGVLARRPEARYRASHKALLELTAAQRRLLEKAARLAGPQTRLIYTTCSLEAEENEEQIGWFRRRAPNWRVAAQALTLPDADRDGGFAAVLTRDPVSPEAAQGDIFPSPRGGERAG